MPGIHLSPTHLLFPTQKWPRNTLKVEGTREMGGDGRRGPGSGRMESGETYSHRSILFALEKTVLEVPLAPEMSKVDQ